MKIRLISILIVLVIILSSCSNQNDGSLNKSADNYTLLFNGENDDWKAELKVDVSEKSTKENGDLKYDIEHTKLFTVKYKGDLADLSSIKKMIINYESSVGKGEIDEDFTDNSPKEKVFTLTSAGNGAVESENDIIEVNIIIDGKKQTLELKSSN